MTACPNTAAGVTLLPSAPEPRAKRPDRDRSQWSESEVTLCVEFHVENRWTEAEVAAGVHRTEGAIRELFKDLLSGARPYPAACKLRLAVPARIHAEAAARASDKKGMAELAAQVGELSAQVAALAQSVGPRLDRLRKLFELLEQYGRVLVALAAARGELSLLDLAAAGLLPDEGIQVARLAQHLGHRKALADADDPASRTTSPAGADDPPRSVGVPLVVVGQGDSQTVLNAEHV